MTVTNPNLKQTEKTESLIQSMTTTTDGTESQRESEELEFDDSSIVDYDLITQFNTNQMDFDNESYETKFNRGLDLFIESVLKPGP